MVWGYLFDQVVGVGLLALLDWAVGVGLLALLNWTVGLGLLAWVSHGYISTPSYLVQGPQTTLGHLGPLLGGTLHHQRLPLELVGASHQMLGSSRPLHGMASFWVIWA